jgi:hypothetical protein
MMRVRKTVFPNEITTKGSMSKDVRVTAWCVSMEIVTGRLSQRGGRG